MSASTSPLHRPRPSYAAQLTALLEVEQWCVDFVELREAEIEIRGWALAPAGDPTQAGFTLNGRDFDHVEYPRPRADIARIFWYLPQAPFSGFICRAAAGPAILADGHAAFRYVDRRTGRPVCDRHAYYYPDVAADPLPLPDGPRRARVHGHERESAFRLEGYTNFAKLGQALEQTLGKRYADFPRVLDWGCGCGRFTRYFRTVAGCAVTGADIDPDNVAWCRRYLGFGDYHAIPLHPPTDLPAGAFDLLIGISVFTHLREPEQLEWLAELQRLAAPGAVLLMTVHGPAAVCRANLNIRRFEEWQSAGFLDHGANPNLDDLVQQGVIADADYYRNVFHAPAYVARRWGEFFDVAAVIPGYLGNFQDVVVLRKR